MTHFTSCRNCTFDIVETDDQLCPECQAEQDAEALAQFQAEFPGGFEQWEEQEARDAEALHVRLS